MQKKTNEQTKSRLVRENPWRAWGRKRCPLLPGVSAQPWRRPPASDHLLHSPWKTGCKVPPFLQLSLICASGSWCLGHRKPHCRLHRQDVAEEAVRGAASWCSLDHSSSKEKLCIYREWLWVETGTLSRQQGSGGQATPGNFLFVIMQSQSPYGFLSPCKSLSAKQGWGWGHPLISHTRFVTDYFQLLSPLEELCDFWHKKKWSTFFCSGCHSKCHKMPSALEGYRICEGRVVLPCETPCHSETSEIFWTPPLVDFPVVGCAISPQGPWSDRGAGHRYYGGLDIRCPGRPAVGSLSWVPGARKVRL